MSDLKQKAKFENQWKTIVDITGNPTPETAVKVKDSEVALMFAEIAKERYEKAHTGFKTKLTGILEAKLALDKSLKQGREDLAKKEEKEYEELNKQLSAAFSDLEITKEQNKQLKEQASGIFPGDTAPQ